MDTATLALRVDAAGVEAGLRQAERALAEFEAATLKTAGAAGGALEAVKKGLTSFEALRGLASWETGFVQSSSDSARRVEEAWRGYRDFRMESARDIYAAEKDRLSETTECHQEATKVIYGAWTELAQNTESTLHTVFRRLLDGTASLGETIKDWFADVIAHLAATAATNRIVIPIMASITGPLGMTTSAAAGMTGGGGFGMPGMGFGFNWFNQPLYTNALGPGMVGPPSPGLGGATWGGALSGLFGGGMMGYGMSGLPGGIMGGGLGLAGYLGGSALGLGGILGSIVPGIGTILGGLVGGLIGKLFGGEPDYWTQSKINMPGGTGLKGFTGAAPSSMLASHWLSDTAEQVSGLDTAAVQKIFDAYVGGVQKTFQSIYDAMPEMFQTAFDEMEIPAWDKFLSDEGKNVGKKLTYQMREWLSTVDFTVTQAMMDTAAQVFGETSGLDQASIDKISAAWVKRDNDFFKSLVDKYDMTNETDLDALTTEYKTYISTFFQGLADISTYMVADPLQEIMDAINQSPIEAATEQFARFDKQIDFLTESLGNLEGQEYANAIANIGTLLTERYNLEIQYITQLSSMMKGLLDSLGSQRQGFMLDLMNPQEKQDYWWKEKNRLWQEFYGESDPTKAAGLLNQWQQAWDQYWNMLPTAVDVAANPDKYAPGAMTKDSALNLFNTAMTAATSKIETDFGGAIQDVIDGHKDTAESLKALGSATEDLKGTITAATTEVRAFIAALRDLPNNIEINIDTGGGEVGV